MTEEGSNLEPVKMASLKFVNALEDAPTFYADNCYFAARSGPNLRISFVETQVHPIDVGGPDPKNKHVVTIVLPLEGFASMLAYFNNVTSKFIDPQATGDGE